MNGSSTPLVSVILPVFNRAGSIARAIESVLSQTYRNIELIIVDDGSTDGTRAVIESYRGAATILLRQDNQGAYVARNLALSLAAGEHVAFIDSDDAWLAEKLERQVPLMRHGVGLVYGNITVVTAPDDGAPRTGLTAFDAVRPRRGHVREALARGNFVPTCSVLVRRSALLEIGGFPEESRISADYLTWFRIARRHEFDYVDAPVALYTQHAAGISFDLGLALAARIRLFRHERAADDDPETRAILDRLLFNLGIHLFLAAARGRARNVERPLALARAATATMDRKRALWSMVAFMTHQTRLRFRRLLP